MHVFFKDFDNYQFWHLLNTSSVQLSYFANKLVFVHHFVSKVIQLYATYSRPCSYEVKWQSGFSIVLCLTYGVYFQGLKNALCFSEYGTGSE